MTDYDTSWVPDGYTLQISKEEFGNRYLGTYMRYVAHMASGKGKDPLGLSYHFLGVSKRRNIIEWMCGEQASFDALVVGEDIPTDAHIVDAFERVRESYEEYKRVLDVEERILGTYPPKTVKAAK